MVFRKTHAGFQVDHSSLRLRYYSLDIPNFVWTSVLSGITIECHRCVPDQRHCRRKWRWCQSPSCIDLSSPLSISSVSANSTESTAGSVVAAELQPIGIRWKLERKRRALVETREGRCVLPRGICRLARSGRIIMSGATTGLEMLGQALAIWPVPESAKGGGPPPRIHPKLCKLYRFPPPDDADYYRGRCSSLEKPDAHSNSSTEWVHEEWFDSDEDPAYHTGYDD